MPQIIKIVTIIAAIWVLVTLGIFLNFISIWIRALMAGAQVSMWLLVGMKLRRVPPALIIDAYIKAKKADLGITTDQLEKHYMAGGSVFGVVDVMIKARHRDINVPFEVVAKTDLAGYDLAEFDPDKFANLASDNEAG